MRHAPCSELGQWGPRLFFVASFPGLMRGEVVVLKEGKPLDGSPRASVPPVLRECPGEAAASGSERIGCAHWRAWCVHEAEGRGKLRAEPLPRMR